MDTIGSAGVLLITSGDAFGAGASYTFEMPFKYTSPSLPPPPSPPGPPPLPPHTPVQSPPSPSTPPPSPPPAPPSPSSDYWTITSGTQYCEILNGTNCVTDGMGRHGHNERCTMRANKPLYATATQFYVENYWDHITINSTRYYGYRSPRVPMGSGDTMVGTRMRLWRMADG